MYLGVLGFGVVLFTVFYVGICRPFLVSEDDDDVLPR